MNKIIVNDEKINLDINSSLNIKVKEKQDIFDVRKIEIEVLKDTSLMIEYNTSNKSKLDILIKINKDINFKLYELKELDIIYLNGENSEINYNFNTISKAKQNVDIVVYHNNKNTISNLNNKAVTIKAGSMKFNVTGAVYNNITDCVINQNNRIINLNDKRCTINPILLIDENDVEANHSALIGKFSEEELFYLMSRGIDKESALNLLIKGFLYVDIKDDEKLNKIIDKYWR